MACVAVPLCTTGTAATAYVFPFESTTELIVAVESFHPTTTTFKFPAVCAIVYTTDTVVCGLCGVAELLCTKAMGTAEETVKLTLLLATPPTVTTTFPVPVGVPAGTGTVMLAALQLFGVAGVPLNVTVLLPCSAPKFAPEMVTNVPTGPEAGLRLATFGERL